MLVVFCVDTSASMNFRTSTGISFLDAAKSAIEHFVKVRQRWPESRSDRYFLITCEDGPGAVKVGWKDSFQTFTKEVKNLIANDLSNLGAMIRRAFDTANQYRAQTGIDSFAQGRYMTFIEPALFIVLTDGCDIRNPNGTLAETLSIPAAIGPPLAGSELTLEPFRWDQRLFSCTLKFPAYGGGGASMSIDGTGGLGPVAPLAEVTGGASRSVVNMKGLLGFMEEIVGTKMQPGAVLNFEPLPLPPSIASARSSSPLPNAPISLHRYLLVKSKECCWPIPERFWTDPNLTSIPPRNAQPVIKYSSVEFDHPKMPENFPLDRYDLDPSWDISKFISAAASSIRSSRSTSQPSPVWPLFIESSGKPTPSSDPSLPSSSSSPPFGFLRVASTGSVCMIVLPFNYPKFFSLLDELMGPLRMTPVTRWRSEWDNYLYSIPTYYVGPLKLALRKFGLHQMNLVPDYVDGLPLPHFAAHLKRIKQQAKQEADALSSQQNASISSSSMGSGMSPPSSGSSDAFSLSSTLSNSPSPSFGGQSKQQQDFRSFLYNGSGGSGKSSTMTSSDSMDLTPLPTISAKPNNNIGKQQSITTPLFIDPFSISRSSLFSELSRARNTLFSKLKTKKVSTDSSSNLLLRKTPTLQDFDKSGVVNQREGEEVSLKTVSLKTLKKFSIPGAQEQKGDGNEVDKFLKELDEFGRRQKPDPNDPRFSVPIEEMGNFEQAMLKQQSLRDPFAEDESADMVGGSLVDAVVSKSSPRSSPSRNGKHKRKSSLSSPQLSPQRQPSFGHVDEADEAMTAKSKGVTKNDAQTSQPPSFPTFLANSDAMGPMEVDMFATSSHLDVLSATPQVFTNQPADNEEVQKPFAVPAPIPPSQQPQDKNLGGQMTPPPPPPLPSIPAGQAATGSSAFSISPIPPTAAKKTAANNNNNNNGEKVEKRGFDLNSAFLMGTQGKPASAASAKPHNKPQASAANRQQSQPSATTTTTKHHHPTTRGAAASSKLASPAATHVASAQMAQMRSVSSLIESANFKNERKRFREENEHVAKEVFKIIGAPGVHSDDSIFGRLDQLQGPTACKKFMIEELIHQAHRFKKARLATTLQLYGEALK